MSRSPKMSPLDGRVRTHHAIAHSAHDSMKISKQTETPAGSRNASVRQRFLACNSAKPTRTSEISEISEKPTPKSMAPMPAVALSLKPGPTPGRGIVGSRAAWLMPDTSERTANVPDAAPNQASTFDSQCDLREAAVSPSVTDAGVCGLFDRTRYMSLTLDLSGGTKLAKPALARPLEGRVRPHSSHAHDVEGDWKRSCQPDLVRYSRTRLSPQILSGHTSRSRALQP